MAKNKESNSIYKGATNRISLNEVTQEARLQKVADYLCKGFSRLKIRDRLVAEWDISKVTANTIIDEAMIYLSENTLADKDTVKKLNYNRLDSIMDECENVGEKLKTIDLINKTLGVYETNVNVSTNENTFKFDIGIDGVN
jgi:predicted Ser/Thr protein kinase